MPAISFLVAIFAIAICVPANAQWLNLPTPGLPRLPDGQPDLAAPAPRTPDGKPDLSGLWHNETGTRYYNDITVDLAEADVAPAAREAFAKGNLEYGKDSMETQCMPLGPAYMTTPYREFRIVQTPSLIVFLYDDGMHREIWLDGRTLEPDPNPTWMGYSVGRWDGDALVVESNGYTDRSWLDFGGHPHTEALRITERYTRTTIGRLDTEITMIDPAMYRKPIEMKVQSALVADTEMIEFVCENHHESRDRMSLTQAADVEDVPADVLSRYVGTYDILAGGAEHFAEVTIDAANLYFDYNGNGRELLVPLSPTTFSWSGSILEFSPGTGGGMNIELNYVEGTDTGTRRE